MHNLQHLNDIASRAWNGTSFSPERRGKTFIEEHEAELTEDLKTIPDDRKDWYAQKYARLCQDYLGSHSNVVSAMIAGPSNFPAARMNKRSDWADNKYIFFREWRKRVLAAIERSERKRARQEAGPEIDQQRAKLEKMKKAHAQMVACNKIIRSKKTTEVQKWDALKELGLKDPTIRELFTPDYMGRTGIPSFSLTNSNARIKHTEARVRELEKREAAAPVEKENADGIKVVENIPENRMQVFFPGKPADEMRAALKRNGFRWAPSNGCWQAYINYRSKEFVKQFNAPAHEQDTKTILP